MKSVILILGAFCLSVTTGVQAQVVINEIDYDQVGADDAEYVELYNSSTGPIDLSSYTLELINGSGGGAVIDESITLTGTIDAMGYYVICQDELTVPNCDQESISSFQNGSPDAVGLRDDLDMLVDAVSYEGDTGAPYTEGTGTSAADVNDVELVALSREPDGIDTNNNDSDFTLRCSTAGQANTLQTTGCETLPVELDELYVRIQQNEITIHWTTLSEVDVSGFEIQEMQYGQYESVGFESSAGNAAVYAYQIVDASIGVHSFRLRVVNSDGSSDYSEVVEGSVIGQGSIVLSDSYPNPFTTHTSFSFSVDTPQHISVTLFDLLGRKQQVLFNDYVLDSRIVNVAIRGENLAGGMYFYRLEGARFSRTQAVIHAR